MKGGKDVQKPTQEAGCRVLPRSVTTGGNTSRECQRESERTGERGPKSKKTQIRQEQRVGGGDDSVAQPATPPEALATRARATGDGTCQSPRRPLLAAAPPCSPRFPRGLPGHPAQHQTPVSV